MKSQTAEHFVFYRFVKNNALANLFTYIFTEESSSGGFTVTLFLQFYLIARQPHATIQPYEPLEDLFLFNKYFVDSPNPDKQLDSREQNR